MIREPSFKDLTIIEGNLINIHEDIINTLPDELILHIFKYLNISDLAQASRVCKKWCRISNDLNLNPLHRLLTHLNPFTLKFSKFGYKQPVIDTLLDIS